jgi:hypothetical protein
MAKNSQICKKMMKGGRKCRKKDQKEGSGISSTDSLNSGSGPDYQICLPLGWALWWGYSDVSMKNGRWRKICIRDILVTRK